MKLRIEPIPRRRILTAFGSTREVQDLSWETPPGLDLHSLIKSQDSLAQLFNLWVRFEGGGGWGPLLALKHQQTVALSRLDLSSPNAFEDTLNTDGFLSRLQHRNQTRNTCATASTLLKVLRPRNTKTDQNH